MQLRPAPPSYHPALGTEGAGAGFDVGNALGTRVGSGEAVGAAVGSKHVRSYTKYVELTSASTVSEQAKRQLHRDSLAVYTKYRNTLP